MVGHTNTNEMRQPPQQGLRIGYLPIATIFLSVAVPSAVWAQSSGDAAASGDIQDDTPAETLELTGEDGMELGPVVVSATRTETPVSELTRSVTVVDREKLDKQSKIDRTPGDILGKEVPGMSPGTNALSNFGQTLRGRDFLTLIDGVPQATPLRGASRDLNTFSVEAVERIEVIRGGTAAYGFGATGGLVNVITRRPMDGEINAHSEAGFGFSTEHPDDSLQWNTSHGISGRVGQFDYVLNGNFAQHDSFFDADGDRIPPDPLGVQGGLAESDEYDVLGKFGYSFGGGNHRIELTVNRFRFEQDADFTFGQGDPDKGIATPAVRGSFNAKNPGSEINLVSATYRNDHILGSALEVQGYYNDSTATFAKFPGFAQSEIESEKFGARSTVGTPVSVGPLPFTTSYGVDFVNDETVQAGIDGPTIVPVMDQTAVAGFAEIEVPVGSWGQIRGGVRHERISVDVDDVTNRQGIDVDGGTLEFNETLFNISAVAFLTDRVEVFGGFSQGFSVGDIGRAIRDGSATDAEQLESEAQKVDNYELGLRGRLGMVSASAAGFYSKSENGTTFDSDLNLVTQPERIWGVELSADVTPADKWAFGGTFTWQEGRVDLDDDGNFDEDLPTTRISPVKLTSYVEYSPFEWWASRLQGLYSGNRTPDSTQFGGQPVDDYVLVDLLSSFDTGYGTIHVGFENLLNNDYFPVVSQAAGSSFSFTKGPGRRVTMTYSVRW
jgi:iron complex outermembrane receptor protein